MEDPSSFFYGRGRDEAALADLFLLCCLLDLHLFLVRIVRGDRFPHNGRQLASSETSRLFVHKHDGNTGIAPSVVSVNRLGTRDGRDGSLLRSTWFSTYRPGCSTRQAQS